MKLHETVDSVWADWGIKISLSLAHKARIETLSSYALKIRRVNPDDIILKLNGGQFQSICFAALLKGFLTTFLKGPFGGQLLVVARDGNNQTYPIAWQ